MRLLLVLGASLCLIESVVESGSYEIDDRIFSVAYLPHVDDLVDDLNHDPNVIKMVTKDNEAFHCRLPNLDMNEDESVMSEGGGSSNENSPPHIESPYELMQGAFDKRCVYKIGVYWTYEYCHGATISQFHASKMGENPGEKYFLGRITKNDVKKQLEGLERKKPITLRLNNEDVPYLEITMDDGTKCDLNNLPRQSRVRFICSEAEHKFVSVQETSTCEYEVIIGFSSLCQHPYFKPKEQFLPIGCHPATPKDNPKPKALLELEEDNKEWENKNVKLDFFLGKQTGSVEVVIKPVDSEFVPSQPLENNPRPDVWRPSRREPFRPLIDPHVAERFLMGEYCLYGGSDWWKFEFCYGKSVIQYHEEKGSPRDEIVLGYFQHEDHMNWINAHPGKKPKKVERKFVSHFYSGGDFCEESGARRHVEVKLKCKKSSSASSVSIYLLEPATCEYVLGVESPLICDILHLADEETGLMTFNKDDFLHKKEEFPEEEIITAESFHNPDPSKDGYDNILGDIQEQLEQAGQNFMEKQKWIDENDNFESENQKVPDKDSQSNHRHPSPMKANEDKISREEQEAYDNMLINSAREAKNSYESMLNNIHDQLEQAGQNFMEKQKWLGDKEPMEHEEDEEEDDEMEIGIQSNKDEL